MRLRRLQLRVQTTDGPYGSTLDFPDGLVVIWADNSMGKSTCFKSILVALGMEAALTHSRTELPLPPAVTNVLESGEQRHKVLESEVALEIQNLAGKQITIRRAVAGVRSTDLITVHEAALTDATGVPPYRDFFVNRQGSASRDAGFHFYLAKFLGWDLPIVQTYDGNEYPLYLQCIFPYFAVEQTRGWSTIQPPVPTQFRIRDVHKRSVEFLLNLEAQKIAMRRQELLFNKTSLDSEWNSHVRRALELAENIGGEVQGLPNRPVTSWPPYVPPSIVFPEGDDLISLSQRIEKSKSEYQLLVKEELPRVQEIIESAAAELTDAEEYVKEKEALLSRLLSAREQENREAANIKSRVETIEEDIQRNKDAKTLKQLGSRKDSTVESGTCPVCHQSIKDSLIPLASGQAVMSLDENIDFLTEQRKSFRMVFVNAVKIVQTRDRQIHSVRDELVKLRERVRVLRQTLVTDGRLPSLAAIQSRMELETRLRSDHTVEEKFNLIVESFDQLSKKWAQYLDEESQLPRDDVTQRDKEKIALWTNSVQAQLRQYAFRSLPSDQIIISPDTYRPEHEGFDLQTSISASDLIRTIWSYLHGMLELARQTKTNHPGLIMFDEPRQQSTREVSFGELLKRSSEAIKYKQQVIFFTSENRETLTSQLANLPHTLIPIEGRLLKKL